MRVPRRHWNLVRAACESRLSHPGSRPTDQSASRQLTTQICPFHVCSSVWLRIRSQDGDNMPSSCNDIRKSFSMRHHHPNHTQEPPRPSQPSERMLIISSKSPGQALAQCLQESDCIMKQRHTPRECLNSPLAEELPIRCQQLRKGFSECK